MSPEPSNRPKSTQAAIIFGVALIAFGIYKIFEKLFSLGWWEPLRSMFSSFFFIVWPLLLIGAGIFFVLAAKTGKLKGLSFDLSTPLRRSVVDKRISGLCGGVAQYLGVDSTIVRILAVVLLVIAPPLTLLVYFIASLIVPR
ncbi:MAG: PspC domain-containing protein [Eggerthellaceae bacterium]|jgi:phage shock protein PspC (stress-responsive transcriptional regulator)|nr:PspC domain-containing protein [Eggerthellaceae bacterium]